MERFWNMVHYCMYELQFNFHKAFRFINPVYYLYKVPAIKRYFANKYGTNNMAQYVDDALFNDPSHGQPIVTAGIHMGIILISFLITLFNLTQLVIHKNMNDYIFAHQGAEGLLFVLYLTIAGVINYALLFRHKKYLTYFVAFNKISRSTINWYCTLAVIGYALMVILTIYSFTWLRNL